MTEPTREDPMPAAVGRYELSRELGRGTMGIVYEAHDPALGRTIALKVIQPGGVSDAEREAFEQRFLAEARIAARLAHPGIVVVHDVGRDAAGGALYIALEYLHGRTLAQIMEGEQPLEWREALRLASQIARALHHAHTQGVVHRDMKPANVMVLESGEPKIMDFGIAKAETARMKLTSPGEFLGTPLYMAPEQALSEGVDARADIFSLGAIAYTLLTGRPAFAAASLPQIVARVVKEEPVPPSALVPAIPAAVDSILARAMAKDPAHRYPNAHALAEDLEDARASRPPRHLPAAPGEAELELVLIEDPLETALAALVAEPPLAGAAGGAAPTTPARPAGAASAIPADPSPLRWSEAPLRAPAEPRRRRAVRATLGGALLLVGLAAGYLALRPAADEPIAPTTGRTPPAAGGPASTPAPTPAPTSTSTPEPPPALRAGRLAIDFEHPLKTGMLRVWVDDELVVEEKLNSRVEKEALVFKLRRGNFNDVLEVTPGKHEIRFQVAWEDNEKTETIAGAFRPGATRRLEARVGRLRKNLSLEWK